MNDHVKGYGLIGSSLFTLGLITLTLAIGAVVGAIGWYAAAALAAMVIFVALVAASWVQPVRGLYLLAFMVPFELIPGVADAGVVRFIGWGLLLVWLLYRVRSRTLLARWQVATWMLILFVGWAFVSLWWTVNVRGTAWVMTLLQLCGLYILAIDLLDAPRKIWNVCLSMALGSVVGLVYLIFFRPQVPQPWAQLNPDASPNHIPGYFMVGFCAFLLLVMTSDRWPVRLLAGGAIGALVYAAMLSGGTGGTIGWIMATIAILFIYSWRKYRSYGKVIGAGIVLVFCALLLIGIPRLEDVGLLQAYRYGSDATTLGGRIYVWQESLAVWLERPLIGWGAEFAALHNTFMWSLVNWGIIGLMLWGGGWFLHIAQALRQVISFSDASSLSKTDVISILLLGALIGLTVNAMTEDIWIRRHLWLVLAMVQAHWTNTVGKSVRDVRPIG